MPARRGACPRGVPGQEGGVPARGGACPGEVCPGGYLPRGCLPKGGHVTYPIIPPDPPTMVNVRAVRILLECILVPKTFGTGTTEWNGIN